MRGEAGGDERVCWRYLSGVLERAMMAHELLIVLLLCVLYSTSLYQKAVQSRYTVTKVKAASPSEAPFAQILSHTKRAFGKTFRLSSHHAVVFVPRRLAYQFESHPLTRYDFRDEIHLLQPCIRSSHDVANIKKSTRSGAGNRE